MFYRPDFSYLSHTLLKIHLTDPKHTFWKEDIALKISKMSELKLKVPTATRSSKLKIPRGYSSLK